MGETDGRNRVCFDMIIGRVSRAWLGEVLYSHENQSRPTGIGDRFQ